MEANVPQGENPGTANQGGAAQSDFSSSSVKAEATGIIGKLEALLDEYMVKKAPFALPLGLKEFIVKISPYLIIVFAILSLPLILGAIGFSAVFAPVAMMGGYTWGFAAIVSLVTAVIVLVMEVMAVPGLFKRTKHGWRLVFYASLVSLIGSVLSLSIISGVIGAIIGWYILFQVKELYKN